MVDIVGQSKTFKDPELKSVLRCYRLFQTKLQAWLYNC